MQQPTCRHLRVRSPHDAQVIFHAVSLGVLPMVGRRLDTEERRNIHSGSVFVWEERGANAEATGLGIERWTDGIRWGPSRVREEFLFYQEKDQEPTDVNGNSDSDTSSGFNRGGPTEYGSNRGSLIKQTYSVFVETPRGRRKWHLIAYFTQATIDDLRSIDDILELARLTVPPGTYKSARSAKGRPRDERYFDSRHESVNPREAKVLQAATQVLAPLAYLQNIAQPRRHPLDEKALMSFHAGFP
ncbi:hypothetical protein FIBSPDRAFT_720022 [Athelia psychrophila]|uniref:Gti1/Pac2 family-domain-containing protein n=1 Tax=Athelia psychrophila TaxID=1759441 RepID=A0A166X4Y2_9AGAM|nr:hypothetical protein FIBSPDRAFT_720022 [Fibularhizoctonia sp. CBS 109695]